MTVTSVATLTGGYKAVETELERTSAATPVESGFVIRRQLRQNCSRRTGRAETRRWRAQFAFYSQADFEEFIAVRNAALGPVLAVTWTPPPPDDVATLCRFVGDELLVKRLPGGQYDVEVTFEEIC